MNEDHQENVEYPVFPAKWACRVQMDHQASRALRETGDNQECQACQDLRVVDILRKKCENCVQRCFESN